ncbi:MAG TPA: phosphodiester glycosidase family protein [Hyphomonadaceae bacterium]|nr:phosphodiester glycosidase family protein [Hyphomonadaceae bacterium]
MISRFLLGFVVLGAMASLSVSDAKERAPDACVHRSFEGEGFVVCRFNPRTDRIRLVWKSARGAAYRTFDRLEHDTEVAKLRFAMNAGMFDPAGAPIGLYVQKGKELHAINTANGPGNFHLKPNGVFWIDGRGSPHVSTADGYIADAPAPIWATQSGPMLVIKGKLHPAINADGDSRYVRNGVGVGRGGDAFFVISDAPVSFGKLARLFRDELDCSNALYLDGSVSSLWAPSMKRKDAGADLGPMVVVTSP